MIHQELAFKISEVEEIVNVAQKGALVKEQPYLAPQSNSKQCQSRSLDLLEVYCGPISQITHHVNRKAGRAMRFTWKDGDLDTLEGVQKLGLWIYLYEPRHIWLAPECRLWGKFANLNMSKS